jgi:ABC-type branched-subunit amino acid transport system permease subunit
VAVGTAAALVVSLVLSLVIGLFSLRVKAIFYAMITLAVASAFQTLASQLSDFTGGEDGLSFKNPEVLSPSFEPFEARSWASASTASCFTYYLLFVAVLLLFLALLRIVNSPFGRVLQAIRENDFRAEAIGFRTVVYRTWSNVLSALFATLAGALLALWLRYVGPDTTLSFEIMLDILLIVVIGGMGTMYGAVVGAALFVLAQNYLQDLLKLGASALEGVPVLARGLARPLAAVAGRAVRAVGLPLPHRHRGSAAARAGVRVIPERRSCHDPQSRYLTCEGREIHVTEWGAAGRGGGRLARPGAHRARHGRHRRAPGAALARDLPRHPGPRPEPVEPAAGR